MILELRAAYMRLPRRFKKVSRKRPEITNLNHQNAFRRVDMVPVLKMRCVGLHLQ